MHPAPDSASFLLQATHVSKSFPLATHVVEVLNDVTLSVRRGELVAMVGASGAGKSTLLHVLGTLDRPTRGTVLYDDQDVFRLSERELAAFRNQRIRFVFQFHHLLPEFTALENTYLPSLINKRPLSECRDAARALLSEVGLEHRMHHKPGELSGGEQQRVAVARALIQRPDLVLADEPTGNLDARSGETLFALLRYFNEKRGTAFIIVTHNAALSARADRVIHVMDGRIVEGG